MASGGEPINIKLPCTTTDKISCGMCSRVNDEENPLVKYCCTCTRWLCGNCVQIHSTVPALQMHQLTDDRTSENVRYTVCEIHSRYLLLYYCQMCRKAVCADCRLSSDHADHDCVDIDTRFTEVRKEASAAIAEKEKQKQSIEKLRRECEAEKSEANKRLLELRIEIDELVQKEIQENEERRNQYVTEVDKVLDQLSHEVTALKSISGEAEGLVDITAMTQLSSSTSSGQPAKPKFNGDIEELFRSIARITLPNLLKNCQSSSILQTLTGLGMIVRLPVASLCSDNSKALTVIKEILKSLPIVKYDEMASLPGDEISIVSLDWVRSYEGWVKSIGEQKIPENVKHYKLDKDGCLLHTHHRFVCKEDAETLRAVFGCSDPLPLGNKSCLIEHSMKYVSWFILVVKEIKHVGDTKGIVQSRLFNLGETLPRGRIFFRGSEVTKRCQGMQLRHLFRDLKLTQYDELSILK